MISRRILAAVALLCSVVAPAHAQKTKATIITEIPVLCPPNQFNGQCTVTNANQLWSDIVNSIMPTAPVTSGNLACFSGTTGLLQDCGTFGPHTVLGSIAGGAPAQLSQTQLTSLINPATPSLFGAVKFDNSTIILNGSGQLQAVGAASTSVSPFTTTVTGGVNGDLLGVTTSGCSSGSPCLSQVTLTAPLVGYTPQGTGGVETTVNAELNRTIWVNDYGAVCNGVTNDTAAFQAAINQGQSSGIPVRFIGTCLVETTQLSITAAIDFGGVSGVASVISTVSGFSPIMVSTTSPVVVHDFGITYVSSVANDTAIIVTAGTSAENSGSKFYHLAINGANIGIAFVKASGWIFRDNTIENISASGVGMEVSNSNNVDSGDSTAYGNTIGCNASVNCQAGVLWHSSGGFRFNNNKINGAAGASTGWTNGVSIQLASGASTSDIFILGNSIEGLLNSGVGVSMSRLGTTGGLNLVMIEGNELGGGQVCVEEPTDANGAWLTGVTVSGNTCEPVNTSSTAGYSFATAVNGLYIGGGTIFSPEPGNNQAVILGSQTATNCAVGPLPKQGTFVASTLSSCTSYVPN
jgi:hypothetical protein